jgi:hypothetical protein
MEVLGFGAEPAFLGSARERQEWQVLETGSMRVIFTMPEHPFHRVRMTESTA